MKTTRMSAQRPRRILHLCALIVLVFPVLPLRGQSSTSLDLAGNVGQFTSQAIVNGNPAISYYDVTNGDLKYVRASDASGTSWGTPVTLDIAGNVDLLGWACDQRVGLRSSLPQKKRMRRR